MDADQDKEEQRVDVHDPAIFEDLAWEVECTAKTWKVLRDRHVPHKLKEVWWLYMAYNFSFNKQIKFSTYRSVTLHILF